MVSLQTRMAILKFAYHPRLMDKPAVRALWGVKAAQRQQYLSDLVPEIKLRF